VDVVDLLTGLVIMVGLVGIVVPVLPGSVLILLAVLGWAVADGSATAWVVLAVAVTLLALGTVVKYLLPHRRLKATGVPQGALVAGGLVGIVGFFVIPVVGVFVGFVLGVYLVELQRVGHQRAWPTTRAVLVAVGFSMLIELVAGLLAASTWLAGAVLT